MVRQDLSSGRLVISLQVLHEYYSAATRKLGIPPEVARQTVELPLRANVVRIHGGDVVAAIELHRLQRISFWDAMIVHAARRAGVETLFS